MNNVLHGDIRMCVRGCVLAIVCLAVATIVYAQNPANPSGQQAIIRFSPVTFDTAEFRVDSDKDTRGGLYVKTNLLYAGTMTPNLALEVGLSRKFTLEIAAGYNGWNNFWDFAGSESEIAKRQLNHILGKVEGRWWFRRRFDGHFLGTHIFYADYKINGIGVPLLFEKSYRYDGHGVGLGLSWGYLWRWSDRWGLEFNLGLGVVVMDYDKYLCTTDCNGLAEVLRYLNTCLGPTSAGIKLAFMIK